MERLTMTNEELNEIRQCYSDFNCPIKAEEDSITQNFCDRVCDEFQEKCPFKNVGLKLKNYEDAEEQGLLLRLPCKIGNRVYAVTRDFISEYTICSVEVYNEGFFFCWKCEKGIYINIRGFTNYQIGEDVFLTKEEAKQSLAEMKGDSDA